MSHDFLFPIDLDLGDLAGLPPMMLPRVNCATWQTVDVQSTGLGCHFGLDLPHRKRNLKGHDLLQSSESGSGYAKNDDDDDDDDA